MGWSGWDPPEEKVCPRCWEQKHPGQEFPNEEYTPGEVEYCRPHLLDEKADAEEAEWGQRRG